MISREIRRRFRETVRYCSVWLTSVACCCHGPSPNTKKQKQIQKQEKPIEKKKGDHTAPQRQKINYYRRIDS